MTKISKLFLAILSSALLISPSYAGEMTVTGGAKATYTTSGDAGSEGKTIGISNELDFTASGELDNGYTWTYQVQLDGATTANDDTKLVLGTDYGTIGIFNTEGGLSQELVHGVGALGTGYDYVSPSSFEAGYDVSTYSNVQYHLPAGMLPFGAGVKVGYAPNLGATTQLSAGDSAPETENATGGALEMITVSIAPIDGLTVAGDAARTTDETGSRGINGVEQGVSANLGAKYTMGQFSVGYTEGGYQPAVKSGEITYYENRSYGIQFDVSDALSLSYNNDESEKNVRAAVALAATAGTKTVVAMEQESLQLAYTTGGATIGIAQAEVNNADYTAGKTETQSVVSLEIAF
tara:strand:- start:3392 stop:4441 length:1050 start_codon:yes stop_codon:yes gene_type:complete